MDTQLLTPAEVVELLGVSRSWLYGAAKDGRIPCVRLGSPDGPLRFKVRDLDIWIEGGRVRKDPLAAPTSSRPSDHVGPQRSAPADITQLRLLSDDAA